jgi:REP element-mobilizing transposase RayT
MHPGPCPAFRGIIVRGIEKLPAQRGIDDRTDQDNFVSRLEQITSETETVIYAWALITNHAHIFLCIEPYGLLKCMQRFLIGYAITYNRRHNRYGHLFQNRYKSIVCDEDSYFRELVRYIHLNPYYVKAGIDQGRRPELVSGGLIRSLVGWSEVLSLRRDKERVLTDERIFVSFEDVHQ